MGRKKMGKREEHKKRVIESERCGDTISSGLGRISGRSIEGRKTVGASFLQLVHSNFFLICFKVLFSNLSEEKEEKI